MEKRITKNALETQAFATEIATTLTDGAILALYGDLGSGKTTFVQGLAKALDIEHRIISPTFIIMRSYERKGKEHMFYHVDLYRTETLHAIEELGLFEIMSDPRNIVIIEWPERLGEKLPKNAKKITFRYLTQEGREITYE